MQATVQSAGATWIIVLLTAIAVVASWRRIVKWLIAIASTTIIAILGFGLIMIWQITHHTMA